MAATAAACAPLLVVQALRGGDAIDDTSVHFLLEMALKTPEHVERLRTAERRKLAREREEGEQEKKKWEQGKNQQWRLRGRGRRGRRSCPRLPPLFLPLPAALGDLDAFPRAHVFWQSLFGVSVLPEECRMLRFFWEGTSAAQCMV